MIRYGLAKMHRRKIRPKSYFYFINSIVQNMPEVRQNFNSIRFMITGKLRGGTSRTKSFSTGFGKIPRQTLDKNIRYAFGNVRSKYGSFGVKLLT
jgi:ribosomal protein S3